MRKKVTCVLCANAHTIIASLSIGLEKSFKERTKSTVTLCSQIHSLMKGWGNWADKRNTNRLRRSSNQETKKNYKRNMCFKRERERIKEVRKKTVSNIKIKKKRSHSIQIFSCLKFFSVRKIYRKLDFFRSDCKIRSVSKD